MIGRITSEERIIGEKSYTTEYKYDKYGNRSGVKYPGSSEYVTYEHDTLGQLKWIEGIAGSESNPAFEYNNNGKPTKLTYDNGVKTDYDYNSMSRPASIKTTNPELKDGNEGNLLDLNYEYDGAGNVSKRNDNQYRYDALNRLISAEVEGDFYINEALSKGHVRNDVLGKKRLDVRVSDIKDITLDYASGSVGVAFNRKVENVTKVELKTFGTADHRVTERTLEIYYSDDNLTYTKLPDDKWKYRRGEEGNITLLIPDGISARFVKVHSKYDERNAKLEEEEFGPVNEGEFTNILKDMVKVYRREIKATLTYDYDSVGNRVRKRLITGTIEETNYTYAEDTNQLLTNGKYAYQYDKAGNMIRKGNKYKLEDGEVTFTKKKGKGVRYWRYKYNLQK